MFDYAVKKTSTLRRLIPFGLGEIKPQHIRDTLKVVWKNRDNLPYAYKVITKGVCDGCALGVAGLYDWTIKGPHICLTRLNLLRLNTMPALDHRLLEDVSKLAGLRNDELRELGRLAYPMLRERGAKGFHRISWDEANERMARRIRAAEPKRTAFFITSRGVTNEVYYMAQKVARFLGTNHIDNAARLCHSPSGAAMKATLGVGASTCSYKDWYGTDLLVFFGSNPANDQPLSTKYIHEAKKLGTKVVLVNPLLEPGMKRYWVPSTPSSALFGTDIADYWFPVTQGGDIAFIYGVLKSAIGMGWIDEKFLDARCNGWPEVRAAVEAMEWPALEKQAGLPKNSMEEFARMMHAAKTGIFVWSMGITQHPHGADGVQMILNLALTRGWVGRDKTGVMPIRGHSSVQGGAEMGAYCTAFPGVKAVNEKNAAALSKEYGFDVPAWPGMTAVDMVDACGRGELDFFYCLGGNFLRTLPEPAYVARAMENVPMRVHQDIILTDQMFIEAREEVLLLPAKTRYEQDDGGNETSTERRIMFSPEIPRQLGECRAEWKILRDLAAASFPEKAHLLGCETGWKMREEIARVVPFYEGVQHLRKTGDSFQYGGPHLCKDGHFETADGKANLRAVALPPERGEGFHVSTRRGKQFNTLIYAETDPLTGADRDAVFMAPADATRLGLVQNESIVLINDLGRYEGRVFLAELAPGNLQVLWPEGNIIIRRGVVDAGGGVPDYNAMVRVEKA